MHVLRGVGLGSPAEPFQHVYIKQQTSSQKLPSPCQSTDLGRLPLAEAKSLEDGCFLLASSFPCALLWGPTGVSGCRPKPALLALGGWPCSWQPPLCWEALVLLFPAPHLAVQGQAGPSLRSPSSRPAFLEEQERGLAPLFHARALPCACSGLQLLRLVPEHRLWHLQLGEAAACPETQCIRVPVLKLLTSLCCLLAAALCFGWRLLCLPHAACLAVGLPRVSICDEQVYWGEEQA